MNDELIQFVRVINWLDRARWQVEEWWEGWDHQNVISLSEDQKILAHWITYITDMQMPAKLVWSKGLPVFAKIVERYSEGEKANKLLPTEYTIQKENTKGVAPLGYDIGLKFTPRYPQHYEQIQRTLEILEDHHRSLVKFMKSVLESYHGDRGLKYVACALFILTYANPKQYSLEDARQILSPSKNSLDLDREFQKWEKTTTKGGQKRLWAALRDYAKGKPLLRCIENIFPSWQKYIYLPDLELPGDIWNERFADILLYTLADRAGIDTKTKRGKDTNINTPTLARKIYDEIKREDCSTLFHPEQLDVSFDFASRMCDKSLCDICIFGKNEASEFCSKPGPLKFCPVLFILTGYKRKCEVEGCPVIDNVGKGLCK